MDLLQKYTEAEKFYELDEAVIETIDELSPSLAAELIKEIQKSIPFLKRKNHRSHIIGGVIKNYLSLKRQILSHSYLST